ncbi:trans-2-enoyl-CoA reductase [Peniophora sp. CONT]|nr:trans-2-enoyl-CoA reductase [Peniophora sp. CONT]
MHRLSLALKTPGFTSRAFSTSLATRATRALVYATKGVPHEVLSARTFPRLPSPAPGTANIRIVLAPVNPSDVNVLEGVYPVSVPRADLPGVREDEELYIAGNEALAEVREVGEGVEDVEVGDWIVVARQQSGTWASTRNVEVKDVIRIPKREGLTEVHAATITVNPPTAWNMMRDFAELKAGEWVVQNGANSAVGQAVIQLAKARGLRTVNLVRNHDGVEETKRELDGLGADIVWTYDDLKDKNKIAELKNMPGGKNIRLALNCVGGKPTRDMLKLLGPDAHLVSYGAMSKEPLSFPTSYFIFKNLAAHGFWQSRWYKTHSLAERSALMDELVGYMSSGKLREPKHEIVTIGAGESDADATKKVRGLMERIAQGTHGTKILLRVEEPAD